MIHCQKINADGINSFAVWETYHKTCKAYVVRQERSYDTNGFSRPSKDFFIFRHKRMEQQ
jgi:hypothetical protein